MRIRRMPARDRKAPLAVLLSLGGIAVAPLHASADEGGVSFWAPGLYGSLAAVPVDPGWSWATVYNHSSISSGGTKTFVRGGRIEAGLSGRADVVFFGPTYTFADHVLGAQVSLSLTAVAGRPYAEIDATLTGPGGNTISGRRSDVRTGFGDLYPLASLKWNQGVNNYMTYLTGDIPVGTYDSSRLSNIGIGHGAIDGGGAYTYLNPKTGLEFSATLGLTYNFENSSTLYRNGVDAHLDWGASYFATKKLQVGAVGYVYNQITGDSGEGATLGAFESRVAGIGPQIGYSFPVGHRVQGYVNLKAYKEFLAQNRPSGWNVWLAVSFSLPQAGQ